MKLFKSLLQHFIIQVWWTSLQKRKVGKISWIIFLIEPFLSYCVMLDLNRSFGLKIEKNVQYEGIWANTFVTRKREGDQGARIIQQNFITSIGNQNSALTYLRIREDKFKDFQKHTLGQHFESITCPTYVVKLMKFFSFNCELFLCTL